MNKCDNPCTQTFKQLGCGWYDFVIPVLLVILLIPIWLPLIFIGLIWGKIEEKCEVFGK